MLFMASAERKKVEKICADSVVNLERAELFIAKGCPKSGK